MARRRHGPVESYRSCPVSTADIRTPATLRSSRPVVMPSERTKNAGHMLSGAELFGQEIQMLLQAADAVITAGMVMPG